MGYKIARNELEWDVGLRWLYRIKYREYKGLKSLFRKKYRFDQITAQLYGLK